MTVQLHEAFAWSVAGFVLGGVVGLLISMCWSNCKAVCLKEKKMPLFNRSEWDWTRVVLGLVILFLITISGVRYYQTTSCQTRYNEAVTAALSSRSEAQRVQTLAQIELLEASLSGDREAAIRETREYIEANQELERVRALSPYPPSPNCGDFYHD